MGTWPAYIVPQWLDQNGGMSEPYMSIYPQSSAVITPYSALLASMQAMSACKLQAAVLQSAGTYAGALGSSPHPLVTDQLRIQVKNAHNAGFLTIPGPIASIFLGDGQTLNTANALVQAFMAQVQAVLGDSQGNAWVTLVGGTRRVVLQGPGSYPG